MDENGEGHQQPEPAGGILATNMNQANMAAVDFESGVIGPGEGKYPLIYVKKSIADVQRSAEIAKGYWKISR